MWGPGGESEVGASRVSQVSMAEASLSHCCWALGTLLPSLDLTWGHSRAIRTISLPAKSSGHGEVSRPEASQPLLRLWIPLKGQPATTAAITVVPGALPTEPRTLLWLFYLGAGAGLSQLGTHALCLQPSLSLVSRTGGLFCDWTFPCVSTGTQP